MKVKHKGCYKYSSVTLKGHDERTEMKLKKKSYFGTYIELQ